ncbi:MAG: bifunctional oligoribonuclease/PAP phosphatase NrnA [Treponema sp.]|jgi:phosphoesterase RecJ-like protein|nr:bifunctional oligoribonuclease/PAP phosphatase NrnA [Treponema sp.]
MANPVPVPAEFIDFIKTGSKFLIAGHEEPDGDCVGSQLALASALRRLGKEAFPCSAGPFKRTEVAGYAPRFISSPGEKERRDARVIIVDCGAFDRIGSLASPLRGLPLGIVDHHAVGSLPRGDRDNPVFLDSGAPSTTFMILELIEALGLSPNGEEANLLLFGLCTDTGFFRHLDEGGAEAFIRAARLIRAGGNPKQVFNAITGGKSFNSRVLLGIQLSRAEEYFGGKLIYTCEKYEETQRFGLEGRDSDSLYQLLLAVAGTEAVAVIRQENQKKCTVGLRSRDRVNVAAIAAGFGGGGHKNAAGFSREGALIEELKPELIAAFEKVFAQGE